MQQNIKFLEIRIKSLFSDSKKQSRLCPNVLTIDPITILNIKNEPAISPLTRSLKKMKYKTIAMRMITKDMIM